MLPIISHKVKDESLDLYGCVGRVVWDIQRYFHELLIIWEKEVVLDVYGY